MLKKNGTKRTKANTKKSIIEAPATKRLKKADAQTPTRVRAAAKTTASKARPTTAQKTKTERRAGSPLVAISDDNRRTHRNATGRRLGPASISGGV